MKIAFEVQRLLREKKHGMDIIAIELLKNMDQINQSNICVYTKKDIDDKVLALLKGYKVNVSASLPYPFWEQLYLPIKIWGGSFDILHCTSNTAPIFCPIPLIVTLHDVIFLNKITYKGNFYQYFGSFYRKFVVPIIAKKAKRIITVSYYEKDRIVNILKIPAKKVEVVYNAVGKQFNLTRQKKIENNLINELQLPKSFVLYFGNTDPKKNLDNVLRAWDLFTQKTKNDTYLVIMDIDQKYLINRLKTLGLIRLKEWIKITGYVSNEHMPSLYHMARIFLYPSLQESFGLPIIEAMSCGTPVITSNVTAMPEIAGKYACFADPYSPDDISEKIKFIFEDEEYRIQLIEHGLDNCLRFSWEKSALDLLEIYRTVNSEK